LHIIYFYPYLLNWLPIVFFSDKGSHGLRELWDTGYQTTICKHWHLWLIIIFGQFLEGWYQGFYQYQPFCWNFIKVFHTYHKLGKRRDFSVYVLKINAQEWRHARGILEYANTKIQWEGSIHWFLDYTQKIQMFEFLKLKSIKTFWNDKHLCISFQKYLISNGAVGLSRNDLKPNFRLPCLKLSVTISVSLYRISHFSVLIKNHIDQHSTSFW
jgi:hypothetical protein